MEGKGHWVDNVMIERFWRSLKHEEVYLETYDSVNAARVSIREYIDFFIVQNESPDFSKNV